MKVCVLTPNDVTRELYSCLESEQIQLHYFSDSNELKQYQGKPNTPIIIDLSADHFSMDDVKEIKTSARDADIFCVDENISRERVNKLYTLGIYDLIPAEHASVLLPAKLFDCYKRQLIFEQFSNEFQDTQKVALNAMTASSEYGEIMSFVEKSYGLTDYKQLAENLFQTTNALGLYCTLHMEFNDEDLFFCSHDEVKTNEQELLLTAKKDTRFHDFGMRMIINFPNASLLVKNMPVEDKERFGHIKDLLPVLMSVMNAKINSLQVGGIVQTQAEALTSAFDVVNESFFQLSNKIKHSNQTMSQVLNDLSLRLPGMALDEDQEAYVLARVEKLMDDSLELLLAEKEMSGIFDTIHSNLYSVVEKQNIMEQILNQEKTSLTSSEGPVATEKARVELF